MTLRDEVLRMHGFEVQSSVYSRQAVREAAREYYDLVLIDVEADVKVQSAQELCDEIKKVRTAVVLSENAVGRLRLKIVAPITEWKPRYASYPWFVHLAPTPTNGLTKDSGADAFQVKSVSETRFLDRLGDARLRLEE